MKNLALAVIFSLMLGGIYFFEETSYSQKKERTSGKYLISNLTKLNGVSLNNFDLFMLNDRWMIEGISEPVSEKYFSSLLKIIFKIQVVREVRSKEVIDLFSKGNNYKLDISDVNKDYSYLIGDINQLSGNFYIKDIKSEKYYLCKDASHYDGVYQNDLDLQLRKYVRFTSILKLTKLAAIDKRVLHSLDFKKIKSIKIDNRGNRWFKLNLNSNTTNPKIIKGLKYKLIKNILKKELTNLVAQKTYSSRSVILSNKLSELELELENNKKIKLKLYGVYNKKEGYFLKTSFNKYVFELRREKARLFFSNVQNFWVKKILYDSDISTLKSLSFKLGLTNDRMIDFRINNIKTFEIHSKSKFIKSISQQKMNFLFNLVLNLKNYTEAKYVRQGVATADTSSGHRMNLLGKRLYIAVMGDEIIVKDLSKKLDYFFDYDRAYLGDNLLNGIFTLK